MAAIAGQGTSGATDFRSSGSDRLASEIISRPFDRSLQMPGPREFIEGDAPQRRLNAVDSVRNVIEAGAEGSGRH